jgi:hypothetical protein
LQLEKKLIAIVFQLKKLNYKLKKPLVLGEKLVAAHLQLGKNSIPSYLQ